MNDNKAIEQEKAELNALIQRGVEFDIDDFDVKVVKSFWGLVNKKSIIPVKRTYKIEEPTLGTLDRLSAEWIEFSVDEKALKSDSGLENARNMTHEHAIRCAKVIAIAVLGSDYLIPHAGKGNVIHYVEDVKRLDELTSLFARTIKPSKLYQLYVLINAMSNLGDFLNSIRLMSADRTTMPIPIEENTEG